MLHLAAESRFGLLLWVCIGSAMRVRSHSFMNYNGIITTIIAVEQTYLFGPPRDPAATIASATSLPYQPEIMLLQQPRPSK